MRNRNVPDLAAVMLAGVAACGSPEQEVSGAPAEAPASAAASPSLTPVVQPTPLTIVPVGANGEGAGEARTIAVEPVVKAQTPDLQPVTR